MTLEERVLKGCTFDPIEMTDVWKAYTYDTVFEDITNWATPIFKEIIKIGDRYFCAYRIVYSNYFEWDECQWFECVPCEVRITEYQLLD